MVLSICKTYPITKMIIKYCLGIQGSHNVLSSEKRHQYLKSEQEALMLSGANPRLMEPYPTCSAYVKKGLGSRYVITACGLSI